LAAEENLGPFFSFSPAVTADVGGLYLGGGIDVQPWLDALPTFRCTLQDLTLWLKCLSHCPP
jgi:hypothetical protein